MGLTGKYDFKGIQKAGIAGLKAVLAHFTWGVSILASPVFKAFTPVIDYALELLLNLLANNGLIIVNVGLNIVTGEFDQAKFDKSMEEGLARVRLGRDKITPKEGKKIDDDVIAAARKFIPLGATPDSVPRDADS